MFEMISSFVTRTVVGVFLPVYEALFSGSVRFFWLYFLSGMAIALIWHYRQKNADPFYARLLNREVWTSTSAINDYYIIAINSVFRVLILGVFVTHLNEIAGLTADLLRAVGVRGTENNTNSLLVAFGLTISLFVVRDAMRFYIHYLMHKVPALWEFHKVHHSAEVLNFLTSERFHPVELVLGSLFMLSITGVVNGVFIAFFGDALTPLTVAGANAFWVIGNLFGGILRHSPFPVSFGPVLEQWFISPAMHQLHHSDKVEHYDSNMGGTLAIWDRMAGTHIITQGQTVEAYGIGEETKEFRSLRTIYFKPFVALYNRFWKSPAVIPGE